MTTPAQPDRAEKCLNAFFTTDPDLLGRLARVTNPDRELSKRADGLPTVSVVIPAYNESSRIDACLTALVAQDPDEIIVVDNNCTDDTIARAERFAGVRIVRQPQQGIGHARALGFDSARGEIIARIDVDSIVAAGWLDGIRSRFANDAGLAAVAGSAGVREISPGNIVWGRWYYRVFRAWHERSIGVSPMMYGFNSAFRAADWRAVREEIEFDDTQIAEDVEVSVAFLKSGRRVELSRDILVKCQLSNSLKFGKLKSYYLADEAVLQRHEFGNPKRRAGANS